ncbi:helix-turn-helix domain-containing protein [Ammoniphilus sp. YIM 78166]|uniref:helix-turn-helix domain-containing protein n=1 Tax=Ammoniphilus sp. YIM 78166 TaxID=1644106 RepID=UPI0010700760|nr:helix-turn-helix transcriptional regulator [Ammoniphilus sp. YIM 78166]
MSSLGRELKRLRELRGLTLEEASNRVEITRQYLSMLEKGQRKSASFDIMNRISEIYDVPMDYLRKFIAESAKELTEEELRIWTELNRRAEEEVYKMGNHLGNVMADDHKQSS